MNQQRGFTLIELLVVISIIGLLATVVSVGLNDARTKSRDAKRLSDIGQIGKGLDVYEVSNPSTPIGGCTSAGKKTTDCLPLPGNTDLSWASFKDPLATATDPCKKDMVTPCQYAISKDNPTTRDYEICFFMESKSAIGDGGKVYRRTQTGNFEANCSN